MAQRPIHAILLVGAAAPAADLLDGAAVPVEGSFDVAWPAVDDRAEAETAASYVDRRITQRIMPDVDGPGADETARGFADEVPLGASGVGQLAAVYPLDVASACAGAGADRHDDRGTQCERG